MKKLSSMLLMCVSLIALGVTFISCSKDDDDENSHPNNNTKKYLAEISVKEYEWKFGERSTYGELYELYTYNEKGLLTHSESHHYNSILEERWDDSTDYTYDENGRLIEKNEYDFGILQYKYKYEYNSFDSVSVMYQYSKDGSLTETRKYEYDNNKRLSVETEIVNYIRNNYGYIRSYEYKGNIVTVTTTLLEDGSFFYKNVYEYDNYHNLVKSSYTSSRNGTTTSDVYKFVYDSEGRVIKKTIPITYGEKYFDYSYNVDGTIHIIHLSNNYNTSQSDLEYTYTYK